jgi:hypothetical protein
MDAAESMAAAKAAPMGRALIVYLDQNKWIDLARAAGMPQDHPQDLQILEFLCAQVEAGTVRLPLTATNIYETHKVNNAELRSLIAYTQAMLSGAEVFRGRRRRLEVEIGRVLSGIYDLDWREPEPDWVFSQLYFEAYSELGDPYTDLKISERVLRLFRSNPTGALFDFLVASDEQVRREAVARFEQGCEGLRADIEVRRALHASENLSMRRRIYSVLLVLDDQDTMIAVADQLGLPWHCLKDNKGATMRQLINETPTFLIEREIALKLEAQARPIHINDMRDMRNFATVLPYADVVVAEKQFTNLARQAGVASRFDVRLETELRSLLQPL